LNRSFITALKEVAGTLVLVCFSVGILGADTIERVMGVFP